MIFSKTPMRITLGGGGTDLKSYYSKKGGHVVSMAINKYIYIFVKKSPNNEYYNLHYSDHEKVKNLESIKHPIIKECLKYFRDKYNFNEKLEISSLSDVISGSGLGSSSSYTIGLLNCLFKLINKNITKKKLAELACRIEIENLKNPIGKQDQYISSYGSIISLKIFKNGATSVKTISVSNKKVDQLLKFTFIYDTKVRRKASKILNTQNLKAKKNNRLIMDSLDKIKEFGNITSDVFFGNKNLLNWVNTLDDHWQYKKTLSNKISFKKINDLYDQLMNNKIIKGGKIIGAGGGGFFLVYAKNNKKKIIDELMLKNNLYKFDFSISLEGSKVFKI
jgi:D-glycero-alpha-D-manno-heptose-7-phosphate kinase